eukprot:11055323-Alexandrium_andersonii.AAC.1
MSASLVGSEMCIRDSPWFALRALKSAFPRLGADVQLVHEFSPRPHPRTFQCSRPGPGRLLQGSSRLGRCAPAARGPAQHCGARPVAQP